MTATDFEVTNLEQLEFPIPCEAAEWWHTSDEPASWIVTWRRFCPCRAPLRFNCDPCIQKILADENTVWVCSICHEWLPRLSLRKMIIRMEPLR